MITYSDIQGHNYFKIYREARPGIAERIFNYNSLRAETKCFSKTTQVYDNVIRSSNIKSLYVPPFLHFQEYVNGEYKEATDRCYLFAIADNIVATLLKYLDEHQLFKNSQSRDVVLNEPRIIAHIRKMIQFYVLPSQSYGSEPSDIDITMHKVTVF